MTTADETAREAAALHLWDEGIIRPESLAREVVDFLIREGHVVLSTPPADDVREALARCLYNADHDRGCFQQGAIWDKAAEAQKLPYFVTADDALSAFEVRPRGTVTDAERQAVADAIDDAAVITPRNEFLGGSTIANILEVADAALEAAREVRS